MPSPDGQISGMATEETGERGCGGHVARVGGATPTTSRRAIAPTASGKPGKIGRRSRGELPPSDDLIGRCHVGGMARTGPRSAERARYRSRTDRTRYQAEQDDTSQH